MFRNVYVIGFVLFILIFLVFLGVNIFFRNVNYYKTSVVLSAFFVPFISAVMAFISVKNQSKLRKKLSFKQAFSSAFVPVFFGGVFSLFSIFLYINYVDKDTRQLLNYQYIESNKEALEEEYQKAKTMLKPNTSEYQEMQKKYKEGKIRIAEKEKKNENMFSFKYFFYVFSGYSVFYILLSVFFGSFFRTISNH